MAMYKIVMIYSDGTEDEQDEVFDTEAEAVAWYKNSFCYIDSKYCSAYLMTGQFYQDQDEEDYDIISSKKLENI